MSSDERKVIIPDVGVGESLLEVISVVYAGRFEFHLDPNWGPMLDSIDGLAPSPGRFLKILDPNGVGTNFGIGHVLEAGDLPEAGDIPGDYAVVIDMFDPARAQDNAS